MYLLLPINTVVFPRGCILFLLQSISSKVLWQMTDEAPGASKTLKQQESSKRVKNRTIYGLISGCPILNFTQSSETSETLAVLRLTYLCSLYLRPCWYHLIFAIPFPPSPFNYKIRRIWVKKEKSKKLIIPELIPWSIHCISLCVRVCVCCLCVGSETSSQWRSSLELPE